MRLPSGDRAGTRLDHAYTEKIFGRAKKSRSLHGLLDTRQRVYQSGGEARNFIYRRKKLVSMEISVWEQVKDKADLIEFIDHDSNTCFSVPRQQALQYGYSYNAGLGDRWGIPLHLFKREGPQ